VVLEDLQAIQVMLETQVTTVLVVLEDLQEIQAQQVILD
jgi:hypothetical protein